MSITVQQAPGLFRTDLEEHNLSIPGRHMIQNRVEVEPEAPVVRHKQPGEEIIYVLEGSLEYTIDGQGARTYNADEALMVPAETVHSVRNVGTGNASELATYEHRDATWPLSNHLPAPIADLFPRALGFVLSPKRGEHYVCHERAIRRHRDSPLQC
jgi:quercetin dioxygenase-like cupin family protein